MQDNKGTGELRHRIWTIVGIVLCVILIPMLIINCTLLIKSWLNEDEVPSFGGVAPFIVLSGSMEEDFPAGSLIFTRMVDASEIDEGDIISYFDPASRNNAVVTHMVRFIQTDDEGKLVFYTYGTANTSKSFEEIAIEECEKVPEGKLIGRYTGFHIKNLGHVAIFMQTTLGLIVCVFVPLLLMIGYDVIRRRIYDKKHQGDKDELMRELEELRKLKAEKDTRAEGKGSGEETPPQE